jgi:hypothetical protein
MPLWLIFHPPGVFEEVAAKQDLARDVTKIYTNIDLPAFYVVVNFIKLPIENTWVGGEMHTHNPFIRIAIEHIAAHASDFEASNIHDIQDTVTSWIDKALKPHIADKGYDWEYHVDETARRLWKENGMTAPEFKSKAEVLWFKENRAVLYDLKDV